MILKDELGYQISGADPDSLSRYTDALRAFQSWRTNPLKDLESVTTQAPAFVMAHVLRAYIFLSGRELRNVRRARASIEALSGLRANDREQWHIAVVRALVDGAHERAELLLSELLERYPKDVLALQIAHGFDHLLGNTRQLLKRVAARVPFWTSHMPGYAAVTAMHAFGLAESGHHAEALQASLRVLEADPGSPRAHHVIAHVHEMDGSHAAGLRWMLTHADDWSRDTSAATHCWWHVALFHLKSGDSYSAFRIYDQHIFKTSSATASELIDASNLLWRMDLADIDVGERWTALADRWAPLVAEGFCAFNDMHAMMAFAGASRWLAATTLIHSQNFRAQEDDMNGRMTRLAGLPASKGLLAYGLGQYDEAEELLSQLPAVAYRLGGSHAQNSIIALTLEAARRRAGKQDSSHRMTMPKAVNGGSEKVVSISRSRGAQQNLAGAPGSQIAAPTLRAAG